MKGAIRCAETRRDLYQEIRYGWGAFRRTLGSGVTSADYESDRVQRSPGTYSDPVYAHYVRSTELGEGIYRMLDARISEYHQPIPSMMLLRYSALVSLEEIAKAMNLELHSLQEMHRQTCRGLNQEIKRYIRQAKYDHAMQDYRWRLTQAIA